MPVRYAINAKLSGADLKGLFESSGLKRPTSDRQRLERMAKNASATVTAWDGEKLVGLVRAVTDFAYCAYISDVGVHKAYQRQGIARQMLGRLREYLGKEVQILLLENVNAAGYYAKLGFQHAQNAWKVPRAL